MMLVAKDKATRYAWGFLLKKKSDVPAVVISLINQVNTKLRDPRNPSTTVFVKRIQTDMAGELTSDSFAKCLQALGIQHQITMPYKHQQNGLIERTNRTIQDRARAMIVTSGLEASFFMDALKVGVFLENRMVTSAVQGKTTPYEKWYGIPPNYDELKVFGCLAIAKDPNRRDKQDEKGVQCVFIGYDKSPFTSIRGWKLWDIESRKVFFTRTVKFFEDNNVYRPIPGFNDMPMKIHQGNLPTPKERLKKLRQLLVNESKQTDVYIEEPEAIKEKSTDIQKTSPGTPSLVENSESEDEDTDDVQVVDDDQIDPPSISSSHSSEEIVVVPDTAADRRESNDEVVATEELRNRRYVKPTKLRTTRNSNKNMNDGLYMANVALSSPLRYNDAMASPEADDWFYAMAEEYSNFKANDTWVMVDLPPGKVLMSGAWVFSHKTDDQGNQVAFKARWVCHGNRQVHGLDYQETFAPTLSLETVRVLTVMAAVRGWNVRTIDVKAAFLHATLNEEVYMSQLKGFEDGSSKVCKLLKSVYGLRQSPRAWYLTLKDWFEKRGYKFTPHEPCLYAKITPNDMIFVEIHVDDFKITSNKEDAI
ncbi:DNA-directed DNA polymerase, partial [Synchytrium endobioticum]